jgi:hypothetical protein
MLSSKILTCKGTLRQVFIRFYRLQIQSVLLIFSTQLCELLPLSGSTLPPTPLPCVSKYTVFTYTVQCVRGGGVGFWAPRHINTCPRVPLQVNFLDDILHCFLWVLFFYALITLITGPVDLTSSSPVRNCAAPLMMWERGGEYSIYKYALVKIFHIVNKCQGRTSRDTCCMTWWLNILFWQIFDACIEETNSSNLLYIFNSVERAWGERGGGPQQC